MNDLLQKLADQCRTEYHDGCEQFDEEKFAELIVRECIAQVRRDEIGPAYEAVGRIARHFFGVEK